MLCYIQLNYFFVRSSGPFDSLLAGPERLHSLSCLAQRLAFSGTRALLVIESPRSVVQCPCFK